MPLQEWIHHWEQGAGARKLKAVAAVFGFIALAGLYDLFSYESFSAPDAMEGAQLARNFAQGKGWTTDSIRPLAIYLLDRKSEAGQSYKILNQPVPDVTAAPFYPAMLAGLMKILPFPFEAKQYWFYAPERWIGVFNQVLFFIAVLLLFRLASRLFEPRVAWLSAILFAGTSLFWKFTLSGLSTIWLIVILLAIVQLLMKIEERDRAVLPAQPAQPVWPALLAGALVGLGALSRYAFAWMIIPVVLFVGLSVTRRKAALCLALIFSFLVITSPWLVRNFALTGNCFGTEGYTFLQDTTPFPGDTLERSSNPEPGLRRVGPSDVINKLIDNGRDIAKNDLPKLGGNWISAFFLVALFIPFRNPALTRLRLFVVGSLILMALVQAVGRTHLSFEAPEINSENLLVVLAPLVFIYGAALFYVLLDQVNPVPGNARNAPAALFVVVLCAPFLFSLLVAHGPSPTTPYSPLHIQNTASLMQKDELMMSDIPWAVAWYGQRTCVWLTQNDGDEFLRLNSLKPIKALFLTERTTDQPYLSQLKLNPKGWGHFLLECAEQGEVPTGFPLKKAPFGFLPDQLFLSDRARWQSPRK